jgi:cytochrome c-type biogenesis protein CcmF
MLLGVTRLLPLGYVLLSSFAVGSNVLLIVRTLRGGWLRIGGYLAHVGMGLLLLGVVGSYAYASEDVRMVIPQGETQSAFGHALTFWGYDESRNDGRHGLRIEVDRERGGFVATPEVYYNDRMGAWTRTPAIKRYLWQDLYISPEEYLPADDPNAETMVPQGETQIGPYLLRFDGFDVTDNLEETSAAEVGATVTLTEAGVTRVVEPRMRLEVGKPPIAIPVELGDGRKLYLDNFVPGAQQVHLRVEGLNLPLQPARAVIQVGTKPAIALVWLGSLLIALGSGLAALRRRLELSPVVVREQVPQKSRGGRVLAWRPTYR